MNDVRRLAGKVRYTASDSQNDVRWAAAHSKKQTMLRSSDWTQLRDISSLLTPDQRLAWDGWRRRVRLTKADDYDSPDRFEEALTALGARLPADIIVTADGAPEANRTTTPGDVDALVSQIDEGTSINAEDAIWEIGHLATEIVARKLRILNRVTFTAQVNEAVEAVVDEMMSNEIEQRKYPLLTMLTPNDPMQAARLILDRYHKWSVASTRIQVLVEQALDSVDSSAPASNNNKRLIVALDGDIQEFLKGLDTSSGH